MSAYSAAVLADSPVSYWMLDEASGTSAADSGAGGNPGTYTGGFALGQAAYDGVGGNATALNGSTGYIDSGAAANLNLTRDLTIEAVIKTTAAGQQSIFSHGSGGIYLSMLAGQLQLIQSQTVLILTGISAVNDGLWHHVAATVDTGGAVALYVDGIKDRAGSTGVTFSSVKHATVGAETQASGASAEFFNGTLSHVAVYNSALAPHRFYAHSRAGNFPRWDTPGPFAARPAPPTVAPDWRRGMLACVPLAGDSGSAAGARDLLTGAVRPFSGSPAWGADVWGPCLAVSDAAAGGPNFGTPLAGAAECTLSALCALDTLAGGAAGLRHLWGEETAASANSRVYLSTNFGFMVFQVGQDGAYPNCQAPAPPLDSQVLVTARLTAAGVRSLWYGGRKVGERTDAGLTYPAVSSGGLVLGTSASHVARNWSGHVSAGYVWNRALSDSEIVALAADPFAPVRPAPARLGVLAPAPADVTPPWVRPPHPPHPPPRSTDLLAWHRTRAPLAFLDSASGGAGGGGLEWLGAAVRPWWPAPAGTLWHGQLAAPTPLADGPGVTGWLARAAAVAYGLPPPLAPAPAAAWRPDFAGGFAPAVRHALIRPWRGPEAHMPPLLDGELAWATDTKSLWVGSTTGNVRIGP